MAKGQVRSNREAKKPKQPKKVATPAADTFKVPPSKVASTGSGAKKK